MAEAVFKYFVESFKTMTSLEGVTSVVDVTFLEVKMMKDVREKKTLMALMAGFFKNEYNAFDKHEKDYVTVKCISDTLTPFTWNKHQTYCLQSKQFIEHLLEHSVELM